MHRRLAAILKHGRSHTIVYSIYVIVDVIVNVIIIYPRSSSSSSSSRYMPQCDAITYVYLAAAEFYV